jgi:hypothetical protein
MLRPRTRRRSTRNPAAVVQSPLKQKKVATQQGALHMVVLLTHQDSPSHRQRRRWCVVCCIPTGPPGESQSAKLNAKQEAALQVVQWRYPAQWSIFREAVAKRQVPGEPPSCWGVGRGGGAAAYFLAHGPGPSWCPSSRSLSAFQVALHRLLRRRCLAFSRQIGSFSRWGRNMEVKVCLSVFYFFSKKGNGFPPLHSRDTCCGTCCGMWGFGA